MYDYPPQLASSTHKFTGKERANESGLDNFGFRYYGSSMGRFSSPDEPFYNGDLRNPQSLNLYAHVQNNPLKNTDPDGHDVRVCVEGADKCVNYTDDQYKALLAAQNGKQGGWRILQTLRRLWVAYPLRVCFMQRVGRSYLHDLLSGQPSRSLLSAHPSHSNRFTY